MLIQQLNYVILNNLQFIYIFSIPINLKGCLHQVKLKQVKVENFVTTLYFQLNHKQLQCQCIHY